MHLPFDKPRSDSDKLEETRREVADLRDTVVRLERRLEKQTTLLQALAGILRQTHGVTEINLLERVRMLEKEKAAAPPKTCVNCNRAWHPARTLPVLRRGAPGGIRV